MLGSLAQACQVVQAANNAVSGSVKVDGEVPGGKEIHYEREFDSFSDLAATVDEAASVSAEVATRIVADLTEAPPPGHVLLGQLAPPLAEFEQSKADYLAPAATAEPEKFRYVQIGVDGYDAFFRSVAELYAYVFQSTRLLIALNDRVRALARGDAGVDLSLSERLDATILTAPPDLKAELEWERAAVVQIAALVPTFTQKVTAIATAAQQLVNDSQNALNAPRLVAHIELIVEGVKRSSRMGVESGKLLHETSAELTAFA